MEKVAQSGNRRECDPRFSMVQVSIPKRMRDDEGNPGSILAEGDPPVFLVAVLAVVERDKGNPRNFKVAGPPATSPAPRWRV